MKGAGAASAAVVHGAACDRGPALDHDAIHHGERMEPDSARRPHIVHLDDDEMILGISRDILSTGGFDITTTGDPAGLLDLGERTFDLLILDVTLAQMDGFSVCQSLRREGWAGAIVVATNRVLAGHERRILDEMQADYLLKPYGPHALLTRVRTSLARLAGARG